MKSDISIASAIKKLGHKPNTTEYSATVKSVDVAKAKATVFVDRLSIEDDVYLTAFDNTETEALLIIPKINSSVIISKVLTTDDYRVTGWTEVEAIHFMGKQFSIVKGENLQEELNKLKATVDLIITAIKNGAIVGGDGGASFKTSMVTALSIPAPQADFSVILNTKIKHG